MDDFEGATVAVAFASGGGEVVVGTLTVGDYFVAFEVLAVKVDGLDGAAHGDSLSLIWIWLLTSDQEYEYQLTDALDRDGPANVH